MNKYKSGQRNLTREEKKIMQEEINRVRAKFRYRNRQSDVVFIKYIIRQMRNIENNLGDTFKIFEIARTIRIEMQERIAINKTFII